MSVYTLQPAQRTAAKVAGFLYVFTMATAVFADAYVRGRLIVSGDAVQTAKNIVASERLFRIGIVSDIITFAGVTLLLWALYVVLEPVNRNLALLAAFWRLVENVVHAVTVLNAFIALRLLGESDYLRVIEPGQLQALARAFLSLYGAGLYIGFVFLGLGSAVFSYLWFRSRYIPRALAVWGIFSSLLLAIVTLIVLILPRVGNALGLTYMLPMGLYEVGLGLWLLIRGLPGRKAEGTHP